MADERKMMRAREVYRTMCECLDKLDWKYDKVEDKLQILSGAGGEDMPISFRIDVDAERSLISLLSYLDIEIPEDLRIDMSLVVSVANNNMVHGSFDYDVSSGNLLFRMVCPYHESLIGGDVFEYMVYVACRTVDDYNHKFAAFASGEMSFEEFLKGDEE